MFAEVDFLVENADQAILDLEVNLGAFFDVLTKSAFGGDCEFSATGDVLAQVDRLISSDIMRCEDTHGA